MNSTTLHPTVDPIARPMFSPSIAGRNVGLPTAVRPFGLSQLREGAPILDLSGVVYDPHTQTARIDESLLPKLGTCYNTVEDSQTWPDKD